MMDLFKDSPVYEWLMEDARAEAHEEMRQQVADAEQREMEARQQTLVEYRQFVVDLVAKRFPKLARLAKKQVKASENVERLRQVALSISVAQDVLDVEILLLELDERES